MFTIWPNPSIPTNRTSIFTRILWTTIFRTKTSTLISSFWCWNTSWKIRWDSTVWSTNSNMKSKCFHNIWTFLSLLWICEFTHFFIIKDGSLMGFFSSKYAVSKLIFWPHPALRTPTCTLYTIWVFWQTLDSNRFVGIYEMENFHRWFIFFFYMQSVFIRYQQR